MEYSGISGKNVLQFLTWILLYSSTLAGKYEACNKGLCASAYGNLLIGRENRLTASSTCGLRKPERFCVITNLEGQKNCLWCDSRNKNKSEGYHGIENVVPSTQSGPKQWWQSQNGVENVTIQLNLENVFYFSYLYIKFRTFRPAAMLVERSADFSKTWQPYGYFAADCKRMFPGVPVVQHRNLAVPYCTNKYSDATPLENGEVILRILPFSEKNITNPFSEELQNLVKFTNLRINFTKLHTLGDDLLGSNSKEIYYYAIYEMKVEGVCACNGHAHRCLPNSNVPYKPNMVHRKCECIHNTDGPNCEKCKDLYNDLKWAPAFVEIQNECKKCNCNNHATRCHFDPKVFEMTGNVSGGVCDDCKDNTMGRSCEQCKHFYYQDPSRDFTDPNVCLPCDCDPAGSLDDGICDSVTDPANNLVSGQCHCKPNVDGRRCDTCKNGFWNLTESNGNGCIPCSCNILGTHANQGCNKVTGECTCKRNVEGRDCNQCVAKHWGLGQSPEGCEPCNCDPGGSVNDYCDVFTGQCKCRPNLTGRTCNTTVQSYYSKGLNYDLIEAEVNAKCSGTCIIELRAPYSDYVRTWTGPGFIRAGSNTILDFPIQPVVKDAEFNVLVRYESQMPNRYNNVQVILIRPDEVDPNGYCGEKIINNDIREAILRPDAIQTIVQPQFCLEAHKNYTVRLQFSHDGNIQNIPVATILIDSVLMVPQIESIEFMSRTLLGEQRLNDFYTNHCADVMYSVVPVNSSDICKAYHFSIGVYIYGEGHACKCDSTGSFSSICETVGGECKCKQNVIGRKCDYCAPGTYGFGPEGCKACDCHSSGALDNFCDVYTGQCKCRPQTYGRSCDQCQPGSWNYPNCQRCVCHGHADICDPRSGVCIDCKNSTEGNHCDRCRKGYYGDPRIGVDLPCRKCPCPGTTESGHSFADGCVLDSHTQDVICECWEGYSGSRCELCSENYFGNPEIVGGKCLPCNCSNNIDITKPHNCDPLSGKCLQCLYNTDGLSCEYCKAGYYGDALQQSCRPCVCDLLGTNQIQGPCDRFSGQCPCLANVTGISCDECIQNHWKIASGAGCEPCACDPNGSEYDQCNQFDGQCICKPGFGGRRCDQCQANYWGEPRQQKCFPCQCDPEGAAFLQCNQTTGHCICKLGIGGEKCTECARGYLGQMPRCDPCGECFDNWDVILNDIKEQTRRVSEKAAEIIKTGTPGSYEFEPLEKDLNEIELQLKNTSASSAHLPELEKRIASIRAGILSEQMNDARVHAENVTQRIKLSSVGLDDLRVKMSYLNDTLKNLKNNATELQEGNVEGALNLTREAYYRAKQTREKNKISEGIVMDAQKNCKRAENFITRLRSEFSQGLEENDNNLQKLTEFLNGIEGHIPALNRQLCDKGGNPCDQLCGGAGCGFCGGLSCDEGALNKADNSLKFAKEAEKEIKEKEAKVSELFRGVTQARSEAKNALNASEAAFYKAEVAYNQSALVLNHTVDTIDRLEKFVNSSSSTPAAIRQRATDTLQKTIQLQPEKITELALKINNTVYSLTNIDAIIKDTQKDLQNAKIQKKNSEEISTNAKNVLNVTENLLSILKQGELPQKQAETAIQNAKTNISFARQDLSEISEMSSRAQQNINETLIQFTSLEEQVKKLQNDFLRNTVDAMNVETELDSVASSVSDIKKQTEGVMDIYRVTAGELDLKASNSTSAFTDAQLLAEKASRLLQNAREKANELEDLEKQFGDLDKDLHTTEKATQDLTKKMNVVFSDIKQKSEYYQAC